jgi:co-chaperonin GroES (HSP10)
MTLRLLRGRVRIRPDAMPTHYGSIIIPETAVQDDGKDRKLGRTGVVLAMGPPALDKKGREVEPGFAVGQRVVYVYGQISSNGHDAWCAQSEICAVEVGELS